MLRPELTSNLTENDISLFVEVMKFVYNFEDLLVKLKKEDSIFLNCHSFTRLIAHFIPKISVVDGHYLGMIKRRSAYIVTRTEHSWITTPDAAIIEVFAVGSVNPSPSLIPTKGILSHAGGAYYLTSHELGEKVRQKVITDDLQKNISFLKNLFEEQK